jgi:hypothetical protein
LHLTVVIFFTDSKLEYEGKYVELEELSVFPTVQSSCSITSFVQNNLLFSALNNEKTAPEPLKIWTLHFNQNGKGTPLVLLHGLCASAGLWALNVDAFAKSRPLYAIDLIGSKKIKDYYNDDHTIKPCIVFRIWAKLETAIRIGIRQSDRATRRSAGKLEEGSWTREVYSVGTFHGWILVCSLCTQISR